jgi:phospholipase C
MRAATFSVKAGDTLREELPLSLFAGDRYEIEIHGPNGFYRSFSGGKNAAAVQAELRYQQTGTSLTGNVVVDLKNTSARELTVQIEDKSYKPGTRSKTLAAGEKSELLLDLKRSCGWYDFVVKTNEPPNEARFAGRVETGRPSFSDPFMGRAEMA